jgi:hypothetical protein
MDFLILIIGLTTQQHQDPLPLDQAILFDHGVVDIPAIHTSQTRGPHLSKPTLKVQEMGFDHETPAT